MAPYQPWHFGITVSDLERAIAFYRDALGLQLRHRQVNDTEYTARMLGYPSCQIEIAQMQCELRHGESGHVIELIEFATPVAIEQPGPMHRIGTVHVALLTDDIEQVAERAQRHGATAKSAVVDITAGVNAGGKVVWLTDPDGVLIELVQPRARPVVDGSEPVGGEENP